MKITQFDNKPITAINIEESSPMDDLVTEATDKPAVGKTIRTNGYRKMEGKIESIEKAKDGIFVLFRIPDGRLMQTPISNVTVVEELSDEETELMELSNDVLTRYKTAAAADARSADKKGDTARGNKRFSGVVKATIKQFDNDKKTREKTNELDMSGVGGRLPPKTPNGRPPGDYWGDNDDSNEDLPHPDDYLYLTKSYVGMIPKMVKDVRNNTGFYKGANSDSKKRISNIHKDYDNLKQLIHLFDVSGVGAGLELFIKLSPDTQDFLRNAWEDHGIDVGADLKKFKLGEGTMSGINRWGPANDVSYEKVLDEVMDLWNKEKQHTDEALDPWHGYTPDDKKANALSKSPKTSMQGTSEMPFDQMVKDTIKTHGLKWAFDYYVRKHGLPPRQFQIFAGLTVKPKNLKQTTPDKAPEPYGAVKNPIKPEKKGWWKQLRDKMPFEE